MLSIHIRDVWNQWLGRLAAMLPRYDPRWDISRIARTEINVSRRGMSLHCGARPMAPLTASQSSPGLILGQEMAAHFRKNDEVIVSVDIANCFLRRLTVPVHALRNIDAVLDLETSRITPFSPHDVLTAWHGTVSAANEGIVEIEHVIIRKTILKDALAGVRNSGASIHAIIVRNGANAALPFAFAGDGSPFGQAALKRWSRFAAAGLILLIIAAAIFSAALSNRQSEFLTQIEGRIEVLQQEAAAVRQRISLEEEKSSEIRALRARMEGEVPVLDVWEELARILPDSAWLQALTIQNRHVTGEGMAEQAEALIAALEASAIFAEVKFTSPIYRSPAEPKSRFSLSLEIVNGYQSATP